MSFFWRIFKKNTSTYTGLAIDTFSFHHIKDHEKHETTPDLLHWIRSITMLSTVEVSDVFLVYVAVQEMFFL